MPEAIQIDWCYFPGCDKHDSPSSPLPTDPRASNAALRAWSNAMSKQAMLDKEPPGWLHRLLLHKLDGDETTEEILTTMHLMETAGLCYFHLEQEPTMSDWKWR